MRYSKLLVWSILLAGIGITSAQAKAADFGDRRDVRHDYARATALRNHIASDRARLREALRHGHYREAEVLRRDIARDEATLNAQYRDVRQDRRDR